MDFSFNEDQQAIEALANKIFSNCATDENVLKLARAGTTYDDHLWSTLAEQGLLGIIIPEAFGGTGLGFTELCLLLEQQGRYVAPTPLFASLALGALAITEFGNQRQKQQWLFLLAKGDIKLSAAIADTGMSAAITKTVHAKQHGNNWTLNGCKDCIPDGAVAQGILVPAVDNRGNTRIFIINTDNSGVTLLPQKTSVGTVQSSLILHNVTLNSDDVLDGDGQGIITWLEQRANIALCALQIGIVSEAIRRTAEYCGQRKQFDTAIGTFQGVAMQAADAYINVEAMRSTYWLARYKISNGQCAAAEAEAAKYWACEGGHSVVHTAQHLHGGIGSDLEYPIHRFFLWAKQISFMLGGSSIAISRLGALLADNDDSDCTALQV